MRTLVSIVVLLVTCPAWAQTDADARRLSVEAVVLYNQAMEADDPTRRLELLEQTHAILGSIIRDFPTTSAAVRLESGEGITVLGQPTLTLERVNTLLEEAESDFCHLVLTSACMLIDLAAVSDGAARIENHEVRIELGPIAGTFVLSALSPTGGLFVGLGGRFASPPFRLTERIRPDDRIAQVFLAAWPDKQRPILHILAAFDTKDWELIFGKRAYLYVWNGLLSSPPSS